MAVTILRNASVLDPERGELAEGQSVAVEDGRIADVGPGLTGPDDALILDVAGRTVMPGLIDAHTHPAIVDADIFAMAEWSPTYVAARAGRALACGCPKDGLGRGLATSGVQRRRGRTGGGSLWHAAVATRDEGQRGLARVVAHAWGPYSHQFGGLARGGRPPRAPQA